MTIVLASCALYDSMFTSGCLSSDFAVLQEVWFKNVLIVVLWFQINKEGG